MVFRGESITLEEAIYLLYRDWKEWCDLPQVEETMGSSEIKEIGGSSKATWMKPDFGYLKVYCDCAGTAETSRGELEGWFETIWGGKGNLRGSSSLALEAPPWE
ncbi:hypothetical protein ACFX2I_014664 [Malus domestica]